MILAVDFSANRTKRMPLTAILLLLLILLVPATLYSGGLPHGDRDKLPKGCGSCHVGHGQYNNPMLPDNKDIFCFNCHGPASKTEKSISKGSLGKNANMTDIQREFLKPYHHPIEKTGIHRYNEILPELDPSMPRHSECGDCHNHHFVSSENKMAGVSGIGRGRMKVREATLEYEVCFKCHSNSANLPGDQRDKAEQFDTSNPSYHPVVAQGRNSRVPSLIFPLTATSLIKCTDCHNSDDVMGPRGPHGSSYRHILARNYSDVDGPENSFQYDLCYGCHRRSSILGNESFPLHREHIAGAAISCRTCHDPHGSSKNSYLIDFENISIRPSKSGRLEFISLGARAGQCFLNCHGKDHDPETYPAGLLSPPGKSGKGVRH